MAWLGISSVGCSGSTPPTAEVVDFAPAEVMLGSAPDEPCREADEDRRRVALAHGLKVDAHEVTRKKFRAVMGYDPSFAPACSDCPVESVTLHEAMAYCAARAAAAGRRACYACEGEGADTRCRPTVERVTDCDDRIPSAVEWVRVARAIEAPLQLSSCMGTEPTLGRVGWYKVNAEGHPHPVGNRDARPAGIYDLWGNVYEWTTTPPVVLDSTHQGFDEGRLEAAPEGAAAIKGGSWYHNAHHARAAHRLEVPPDRRLSYVGLRCVRAVGDAGGEP